MEDAGSCCASTLRSPDDGPGTDVGRRGSLTACARSTIVVRAGHVRECGGGRLALDEGSVPLANDAVVVHCAATGRRYPPRVPIWGAQGITLQPIRAGFPCFGAAMAGFARPPATTTTRRTASARRRRTPTPPPTGSPNAGPGRAGVDGAVRQPRDQGVGQRGGPQPHAGPPGDAGRPRPGRRHRPLQGRGRPWRWPGWPSWQGSPD